MSTYESTNFLFKDLFPYVPESAVKYTDGLIKKWKLYSEIDSGDVQMAAEMKKFVKKRCMHTVWVSDKFREELPQEENKTFRILSDNYDHVHQIDLSDDKVFELLSSLSGEGGSAEKDRYQKRQLQQHLLALLYVMKAARDNRPLSEDFIKTTHKILMHELLTGDNEKIIAGEYRECMVSTSSHTYPDHKCIEESIARIVTNYEMKVKAVGVDKYHRAGWLLLEILSLHPFLDGNGRLSRLLWNYSLIRNGLPFPVIPFSGITSKPYKVYIRCLTKDRERQNVTYVPSMTLISVTKVWLNFIFNLQYESPDSHDKVTKWLQENDSIALKDLPQ